MTAAALPRLAATVSARSAAILPLVLDGVCFEAAGARLIDDISAVIEAGPKTIILGPNGAGKSLLLRLCHGLIQPTAGRIVWGGDDPRRAARGLAMVFQRPVLLRRSAVANVSYALSVRGVPRAARRPLVEEALAQAGLTAVAHRLAPLLSGGERQRLALARAWAIKPHVLLLDEPTVNLDPAAVHAVEEMIVAIQRGGTKIIMTTHDLHQSRRLADEVLFLHHGRLVERGPATSFFAGPRSAAAADFLEGRLVW